MFSPAVGNGFQLPKFKNRDLTGDSKYPLFTELYLCRMCSENIIITKYQADMIDYYKADRKYYFKIIG